MSLFKYCRLCCKLNLCALVLFSLSSSMSLAHTCARYTTYFAYLSARAPALPTGLEALSELFTELLTAVFAAL
jgi:hypothetical protein